MDLSKLPKLSESPAPPPPIAKQESPPAYDVRTPEISVADLGIDIILSLVVGVIFLMPGAPFGGWLIAHFRGVPYETGVVWNDGRPVGLFELEGGSGWLYMGEWVLAVCLLLEAALVGLAIVARSKARKIMFLAMVLGIIGALANVVAIMMQIKAGFTSPIFSLVGLLIGLMMAFAHGRHVIAKSQ